ncbi:hypothetical protein ACFC1B_30680, partial [Streptomyces xiamenensis]
MAGLPVRPRARLRPAARPRLRPGPGLGAGLPRRGQRHRGRPLRARREGPGLTMDFLDAYHLWADAHAFFDSTLIPSPSDHTDPLATQTAGWERRLAEETPNGHLLRQNALFEALSGNGKLHLLHVTHALEEISRQGVLY